MAIVYRHIRLDKNEVFYIGIGKTEKRAYEKHHHRSQFWKNISKIGYEVEIMFEDLTWGEACIKETEFIKLYGRKDLNEGTLVNMTNGGDGGFGVIVKEETKKKIRQYQLSLNKKGKPGRIWTEESKTKLSQTLTGFKHREDSIIKMQKPKLDKKNYSYPKSKIMCPHCQFECQPSNAYRWHFDNCKLKK